MSLFPLLACKIPTITIPSFFEERLFFAQASAKVSHILVRGIVRDTRLYIFIYIYDLIEQIFFALVQMKYLSCELCFYRPLHNALLFISKKLSRQYLLYKINFCCNNIRKIRMYSHAIAYCFTQLGDFSSQRKNFVSFDHLTENFKSSFA